MFREELERERLESLAETSFIEDDGEHNNSDGDEQDEDEPFNDVHGLLC